jgi:hypothetical protein
MVQTLSAGRLDNGPHPRPISLSDDQLRTELDLHAMTLNRGHYFDYYFGHSFSHHLGPERSQQARRRDDWAGDAEAMWRRWDQITVLRDEL